MQPLDIAKKALRDGLWDIARSHASKLTDDESKLIILESFAREGKWESIKKSLESWLLPVSDAFNYFRALSTAKITGDYKTVSDFIFSNSDNARKLALLRAQMAFSSGDLESVKQLVEEYALDASDCDGKALSADVYNSLGEKDKAKKLWLEVVSSTNASDMAYSSAAWNLADVSHLRKGYESVSNIELRRALGLKLGAVLLESDDTFEEGRKLVVSLANDFPGTRGAEEAFVLLAEKTLSKGNFSEAAELFHRAIEAWPNAARRYAVNDGYAWALLKSGKAAEALQSFIRAEQYAQDDAEKASAILKQGDVLSSLGRGDESMSKYRVVLGKYPGTAAGLKLKTLVELKDLESKGRDYYHDFRFSEALKVFSEISARDPSRKPRMDYLEMLCLYGQGKDREASIKAKDLAAGCLDATIKAEATLWLAKFFYNASQWTDACTLFTEYATNMMPHSAQAPSALLWASRAAFAGNDFKRSIDLSTKLAKDYPDSQQKAQGYILQGEALIELSRFDDAIVVLEKAGRDVKISPADRIRARILTADAMFIMGADNPVRYNEALSNYTELQMGSGITRQQKINLSFKIARTLEKLNRIDQALEQYYCEVILPYRNYREEGVAFDENIKAIFARAVFRMTDEYERRGQDDKAINILRLLATSDVNAAAKEAGRRLKRLKEKGIF